MSRATSFHASNRDEKLIAEQFAPRPAHTTLANALNAIVAGGVLLRVLVTVLAGNGARTPWGGGGDTPAYLLLAQNLLAGKGYAYAGMPTAFRAPGYPILLAAVFRMFNGHALAAMRWLQFFEGLAVALLCAAAAGKIFGKWARKFSFAVALFFPTLLEMNGEILSEGTATLFAALFLYLLVSYLEEASWKWLVGMACAIGLGALVRFNIAALGIVALAGIMLLTHGWVRWKSAATVAVVSLLFISPWIIRNLIAFHGQVLFSTESGADALHGVLTPQGRALPGDSAKLRAAVGWVPPVDLETNAPSRLALGPEPELDNQCWRAAIAIAMYKGWALIPLELRKLSDFWLSTDQLLWTASFATWDRIMRAGGVLFYWGLLALAIAGWFRVRSQHVRAAWIFLLYAVLVTAMHLPFVMSTRLRMPLIDPMLAMLAGDWLAGFATSISRVGRPLWKGDAAA